MLHIGAAESVAIVRVNDHDVGIGKDSHLASEFEIGDALVPGTNTLEVRVVKWSDASFIEDQDEWWLGGITRSVFLYSTGRTYLADIKAIAGLADDLTTGTLDLGVQVAFDRGLPEHGWTIEADLGVPGIPQTFRAEAHVVDTIRDRWEPTEDRGLRIIRAATGVDAALTHVEPLDGSAAWQADVRGIAPWSSEVPTLYPLTVRLKAPSGELAEEVRIRIGFRRVEIAGLDLLINGRRVLIRGVNRHDFDQHTGRTVTADAIRTDLITMKRFNFNAVRTSHYPNDPALVELADELGLYVIAEADIESHAYYGTLCDDPRYLGAWVDRCARLALRDKNHASIIAWSLGNESGYGPNHDAAAGWLRAYDPSRPLHYEGAIRDDWTSPQTVSDITGADVPHDRLDRGPRHERHAAPPADHVRVLPRDGQQQRDARRVLGGDRVHARAPGRVHLGVLGPRARPAPAGRHDPLDVRWRLGRRPERQQLLPRRARVPRPDPSPGCGSTATSRRRSGSRPIRRARPPAGSRSRTGRTSGTWAGCVRAGSSRWTASRSPRVTWPCRRWSRATGPSSSSPAGRRRTTGRARPG